MIVLAATFATCASQNAEAERIARRLGADPELRTAVMLQLADNLEHFAPAGHRALGESATSGSGSGSSGSGSGSGSGSEYPPHTFFALTCGVGSYPGPLGHECTFLDWSWYGCWVCVIIGITIVLEGLLNKLKTSSRGKLGQAIYEKILIELTMFGTVALSIVILANVPPIRAWLDLYSGFRFVMLEMADVTIFLMALIHCANLLILERIVRGVQTRWERLLQPGAAVVLERIEELLASWRAAGEGAPARPRSERREMAELMQMAEFECVSAEFRRQHMLTHVKKFSFVAYLSKALLSEMVLVINFSLRTWACLAALHILLILIDDGQAVAQRNGFSRDDDGGQPWNFGPHPISLWHAILFIVLNWGVATLQCVLWLCASRRYQQTIARIFNPFSETWTDFVRLKSPSTYECSERLPADKRSTVLMLYGFVSTLGEGPFGTKAQEAAETTEGVHAADDGNGTSAPSPPPSPPTPDEPSSGRSTSSSKRARRVSLLPSKELLERMHDFYLDVPYLHRDQSVQSEKSGQPADPERGSATSDWILKAMETNTAMMSYLASFSCLFWMRESYHVPFLASPRLMQKAMDAGSASLDLFTPGEVAYIVLITLLVVVLMLAPYAVFIAATARIVQYFSIASAVKHVDTDIMNVLEAENEKAGDYVSAMLLVRNHLARTVLPENASLARVRERVDAKLRLGEFYWRYRAVLPGESPLTEAIAVLEEVRFARDPRVISMYSLQASRSRAQRACRRPPSPRQPRPRLVGTRFERTPPVCCRRARSVRRTQPSCSRRGPSCCSAWAAPASCTIRAATRIRSSRSCWAARCLSTRRARTTSDGRRCSTPSARCG